MFDRIFNVFKGSDKTFLIMAFSLTMLGLVMVVSASAGYVIRVDKVTMHSLVTRQLSYVVMGLLAFWCAAKTPTQLLNDMSLFLLILAYVLLGLVLIPGFGVAYNGAQRWLDLGFITLQISEFARLFILIYLSSYMVRRGDNVRDTVLGFILPMALIAIACAFLLGEPDFGAAVILTLTCLGMLFLAGARIWQFMVTILFATGAFFLLTVTEPYRMKRLMAFLDPWRDSKESGYQLIQSLLAYGSGGFTGSGLGGSVQKLGYLPEAHNDFILAVLAEELGFASLVLVLLMYSVLIYRVFVIGSQAVKCDMPFGGFLCFGIAVWLVCQVFVNVYVTLGLLPTKGLTLPLMSSGGSAMLMASISLGIVLRVSYEIHQYDLSIEDRESRKRQAREKRESDGLVSANADDIEALKSMLGAVSSTKGSVQ